MNLKRQDLLRNLPIKSNNNSNWLLNKSKLRHPLNKRLLRKLKRKLLKRRLLKKKQLPSKRLPKRRGLLNRRSKLKKIRRRPNRQSLLKIRERRLSL